MAPPIIAKLDRGVKIKIWFRLRNAERAS